VHSDRRLVDLFGFDTPFDVFGGDVDRQRLADRINGDISVVDRAEIEPPVAAVDCSTPATERYLDAFGDINEIEILEITAITENRIRIPWLTRSQFDPFVDRIATPGTKIA
jgi:hypothetical protein